MDMTPFRSFSSIWIVVSDVALNSIFLCLPIHLRRSETISHFDHWIISLQIIDRKNHRRSHVRTALTHGDENDFHWYPLKSKETQIATRLTHVDERNKMKFIIIKSRLASAVGQFLAFRCMLRCSHYTRGRTARVERREEERKKLVETLVEHRKVFDNISKHKIRKLLILHSKFNWNSARTTNETRWQYFSYSVAFVFVIFLLFNFCFVRILCFCRPKN